MTQRRGHPLLGDIGLESPLRSLSEALSDPAPRRAALAATAATFVVVLIGIANRDLWLDEAFTITSTNQLWTSLRDRAGSMGAYYVLMAPWSEVATSTGWLRVPSALFAALASGLTVLLSARMFVLRVSVRVAMLMPLIWGVVRYGQELRSYSLMILLVVAGWHALLSAQAHEGTSPTPWTRLGVSWGLALYAHPLAALNLPPQLLWLWWNRRDSSSFRQHAGWSSMAMLVTATPILLATAASPDAAPDWIPPLSAGQLLGAARLVLGDDPALIVGSVVALATATVIVASRRSELGARRDVAAMVAWVWLPPVLLAAVSLVEPLFRDRYLVGSLPAAAILLAAASATVRDQRIGRIALGAFIALGIIGQGQNLADPGDGWSDAASAVSAMDIGDCSALVFPSPMYRQPLELAAPDSFPADQFRFIDPLDEWGTDRRYPTIASGTQRRDALDQVNDVVVVFQSSPERRLISPESLQLVASLEADGFTLSAASELSGGVSVVRLENDGPCPSEQ